MATRARRTVVTSDISNTNTEASEVESDDVTVTVPKAFTLTLDNGGLAHYKPGVQEMPLEHAEHWFAKAQGVTVYNPPAKAEEAVE